MEPIEKIEKVCAAANVTFEEAREALEANNWDVVETLIALEREGKKIMNEQVEVQVEQEEAMEIIEIKDYKEEEVKTSGGFRSLIHKAFDYLRNNSIRVEKDGTEIITIKLILFLILFAFASEIVLLMMIIGLFFKFNYSLVGKNKNEEVNKLMNGASRVAQAAAQGFKAAWEQK